MIFPLFVIPFISLLFINFANHTYKLSSVFKTTWVFGSNFSQISKFVTLASLYINLSYAIILWKQYPKYSSLSGEFIYPSNSWFELHHNLNLPFIILSITILIVALLTAWYSDVNTQLFLSLISLSEICLIGTFSCTNLFVFLLFFEASAIPIFLLIVYCGSDRRERLKASYYFLFFTLYGSISLLLLIINVNALNQINFTSGIEVVDSYSLWILLFTAFAVKIPLFPVHIWLPYAHVEASTATSILLAALMLKLGGYGVLRFMLPLFDVGTHLLFRPFAVLVCLVGVVYGGLAALRQIDLKRQIAFSSIAHMSFAMLGVFSFTEIGLKGALYLMLSHGLTSSALFYLVGVLSERYHTRAISTYSGLFGVMPVFVTFLLIASLANVGFPGTSGFIPELYTLVGVLSMSPLLLLLTLFGMLVTTASSLVLLLRVLFGHVKVPHTRSSFSDLSRLEFAILAALSGGILYLGFVDIFVSKSESNLSIF